MCINLEEFADDDVFDGSVSYHSQDKKKGAFLPGLKVTAEIIDVEPPPPIQSESVRCAQFIFLLC